MVDVGGLLDRIGVDAALHGRPSARRRSISAFVATSKPPPPAATRAAPPGAATPSPRSAAESRVGATPAVQVLLDDAVAIEYQQWRAVLLRSAHASPRCSARTRMASRSLDRRDGSTVCLLDAWPASRQQSVETLVAEDGENVETDVGDATFRRSSRQPTLPKMSGPM